MSNPTFLDLALKLTEIRTLTGELSEFDKAFLASRAAVEECLPPLLRLALERPEDLDNVRVKVAVIGNFSAGKSTLINAILGRPVCPMKVGESTVGYTSFRYADREEIHRVTPSDKGVIRELLSLKQYTERVTAGGDAGGWFEYGYPFHGLRDIELIDTPGFIGSNPRADQLTERITKEADVALVVFDINEGEPKRDLLQRLKSIREDADSQLKRLFLVLNKADAMVDEDERQSIVRVCEKNGLFDDIHVVSARDILQGCYFHDLADVGPRLRASIGHVMKSSGGGRWSLDIKLASDKPQQYSLDIGGNGDANTPGGRMALIKPLTAIQGDKTNLLRAQRTRAIRQELGRIKNMLNEIVLHCDQVNGGGDNAVAFDKSAYWDIVNNENGYVDRFSTLIHTNIEQSFKCIEIEGSGFFENDWRVLLNIEQYKQALPRLEACAQDFSRSLFENNVVSGFFDSAEELFEWFHPRYKSIVATQQHETLGQYPVHEWRYSSKTEATRKIEEWIKMDAEQIMSSVRDFLNLTWGDLNSAISSVGAFADAHTEIRKALTIKTIEKSVDAKELARHLRSTSRPYLTNPRN